MNVLIIGKNSYIGNHINEWLKKNRHQVTQLDVLTDEWKNFDYSSFDAIVHVAGIVHQPKCQDWNLYKRINTDMPIAIAKMAKEQGVKQYVFLSTMGVYGVGKKLTSNVIDETTPLFATDMYGRSKLMAEDGLKKLQGNGFNVVCVRPPSVYGKGCRGGYISGFTNAVKKLPIIPSAFENAKQSFIYVDNLSELIRLAVEHQWHGIFCPQDDKAVSANELFRTIAKGIGKQYHSSRFLGLVLNFFRFLPIVRKVYGGVEYDSHLSDINGVNYVLVPLEEGIKRTVSN